MARPTATELERVVVDAMDREPDTELLDTPDWVQVRTPSSRWANHNAVLLARLDPDEIDAKVAEVASEHAARGAKLRWVVGPSSRPHDLATRLRARGFVDLGGGVGMAIAVPDVDVRLGVRGLTVHEVGPDDLDAYTDVTTRAWERGPDFAEPVRYIAAKSLRTPRPEAQSVSWIARLHGEPVATSHLRLLPALGYLQGCAVLPAHRGRGIYRALVHHRLAYLRTRGRPTAVIWADPGGSGIACTKIGFTAICTGEFFESERTADFAPARVDGSVPP